MGQVRRFRPIRLSMLPLGSGPPPIFQSPISFQSSTFRRSKNNKIISNINDKMQTMISQPSSRSRQPLAQALKSRAVQAMAPMTTSAKGRPAPLATRGFPTPCKFCPLVVLRSWLEKSEHIMYEVRREIKLYNSRRKEERKY